MICASYLNNDNFWLNKFCKSDTFVSYIEFIGDMCVKLKKLYWGIGCQIYWQNINKIMNKYEGYKNKIF